MNLSPIQKVKLDLLEKYKSKIKGSQPLIQNCMLVAYEAALNDCFQWVYEKNQESKPLIVAP